MTVRLSPEEAVLHPRRAEILNHITVDPGLHIREIARRMGCPSPSPIEHHIRVLTRAGMLEAKWIGNKRGFFLRGEA